MKWNPQHASSLTRLPSPGGRQQRRKMVGNYSVTWGMLLYNYFSVSMTPVGTSPGSSGGKIIHQSSQHVFHECCMYPSARGLRRGCIVNFISHPEPAVDCCDIWKEIQAHFSFFRHSRHALVAGISPVTLANICMALELLWSKISALPTFQHHVLIACLELCPSPESSHQVDGDDLGLRTIIWSGKDQVRQC